MSIVSNEAPAQRRRFIFRAMACDNIIEIFSANVEDADQAAASAIAEVVRIETKYSRYRDDSVVTAINRAAGVTPIEIDAETSLLLDYVDECFRQSNGAFDITSGVLRRAWKFSASAMASVPTAAELAPLLKLIGWQRVRRQQSANGNPTLMLPDIGMEIDFGGFGKEYAADRAAAVLLERGMRHAFVNLGGDVVVTGPQASGEPWLMGIQHPRAAGTMIATLPIRVGAVATSGDYERYIEIDGVRHSHVLDPVSGQAVRGMQSATVFAPTCLVAGSIATMAMLHQKPRAWLSASGADYFAVDGDGRVFSSPALRQVARTAASTSKSNRQ